ncbi:PREDICTED: protein IWS1 homolog A-like [Branchiostoma belcheri]|uniref:Protein IWS1 homolog A-like n=1 Tax=Branchiostoma belcheri TaxID=7741 RepID=A0A6P5ACP0_BRABE|nr:PREDICTED: protein IWS1 homolog A-like [Branchiostoma belcheri]
MEEGNDNAFEQSDAEEEDREAAGDEEEHKDIESGPEGEMEQGSDAEGENNVDREVDNDREQTGEEERYSPGAQDGLRSGASSPGQQDQPDEQMDSAELGGQNDRSEGEEEEEKEDVPSRRRVRVMDDSSDEEGENRTREDTPQEKGSDAESGEETENLSPRKVKRAAVLSDDEDEDTQPVQRKVLSSDEDSDSNQQTKKRVMVSDDDDDDDEKKAGSDGEVEKDSDDEDKDVGDLIADIFGDSDEDEEFEGFGEAEVEGTVPEVQKSSGILSDSEDEGVTGAESEQAAVPAADSSDSDDDRPSDKPDMVSDFDVMLQKRKAMNKANRRKRKDHDLINDCDDLIVALINKMKAAVDEDRVLNQNRQPAVRKLKMLSSVMQTLRKKDLQEAILDCGMLPVITDWLSPLPDRSLPHLHIREEMLKILQDFPPCSQESLKSSGIGRAVMYLYKHPKETRNNKERAGKLINEWSRPIFGLNSNFKSMSREEREQRDMEQMPKRRRMSSAADEPRRSMDMEIATAQGPVKPGDPGWCARARVPMPSNRDYVVRPKWNTEKEMSEDQEREQKRRNKGFTKTKDARLEKHMKTLRERKAKLKIQRAVGISIQGNKMAL